MTTVTGKLIAAASPQRVEMKAFLVDVTGKDAIGYVASVPGELVRPVPITPESDGDWSAVLTANSLIESDAGDTLWAIQEGRAKDGTPNITYVSVPDTGSHWVGSIRADLSDTQTGQGTVVYLPGPAGPAGATGPTGAAGADGEDGQDGASAYQVAVAAGFTGTEAEWLDSLVGPQGETGPQGPAGSDGTAEAQAYTDSAVSTHAADTTSVHGIADTTLLETTAGAQSKADAAQSAATTAAATDATSKVTAHTGATDPHGDRAWADTKFATTTALGTVNDAVTDLDGFVQDCLTRVSAIEQGTAWLSGLNVDGNAQIADGDLTVKDVSKGYRFRRGGSALDLEATGADLIVSNWSGTGFNGTQRAYDRYSADALNVQHAGKREYVSALYGTVVHTLDPATGVAALGGKNGLTAIRFAGLKATPGAPTTGAWTAGDTITGQALTAGAFYWVGMLFNGSVPPTLTRASGWTGVDAAANLGLPASALRFATNGTGRSALPATITPGSNVGTDIAGPWAAVGP